MKAPTRPILAFAGVAGSGKTTAARAVSSFCATAIVRPFAYGLKHAAHQLFGPLSKEDPIAPGLRTGREAYQTLGDFARSVDPLFAIKRMLEFQRANPGRNIVIDDIRTEEEAKWVGRHPDSRIIWIRPMHDPRTLAEIAEDIHAHSTELLAAAQYADYHHSVTHDSPSMLGEELHPLIEIYHEVFG